MSQSKGDIAATLGLAGVLSALVGGMSSWFVARGVELDRTRPHKARPALPAAPNAQVAELELEVDRLSREVSRLRQQRSAEQQLVDFAKRLDGDSVAEGTSSGASELAVPAGEDPRFELAVRQVLDRVDWERDQEQRAISAQRREQRAARQVELLSERLKLDPTQKLRLAQALSTQMETLRTLREPSSGLPPPATRSEWQQRLTEARRETELDLASFLTEEQLTEYRKFVEEEGLGWAGRRPMRPVAPQP